MEVSIPEQVQDDILTALRNAWRAYPEVRDQLETAAAWVKTLEVGHEQRRCACHGDGA